MTIYVDIVLLENLCMNYIILFGTAYIIKLKIKHLRILASSLIGAIYAILAYSGIFEMHTNIFVKIVLSICMVYIAYNPRNVKAIIKELIIFYLVSFALGGCAFALLYIVKPQDIFVKDGVFIGTYPIKIALLGGIVGFWITYIAFKLVKNRLNKTELIYEIHIKLDEKEIKTKVMLDTGNMLKDPITNTPVALIDKSKLYGIFPKEILDNIREMLGGEFDKQDEIEYKYKSRLRIIPYTSVGKQNGMILGIKVDEIKVITDIDEIINEKAIIGIYDRKFSKTEKYCGLIGLDMLERRKYEYFTNIKK